MATAVQFKLGNITVNSGESTATISGITNEFFDRGTALFVSGAALPVEATKGSGTSQLALINAWPFASVSNQPFVAFNTIEGLSEAMRLAGVLGEQLAAIVEGTSSFSSELLGETNAAGWRSALGLGTAATANVTTSATDATTGRVIRAEDGVLNGALSALNSDTLVAGVPASQIPRVEVSNQIQKIKSLLSSGSDGIRFVTLGDSIEAGVGGSGGPFAESTDEIRNGYTNRVAWAMARLDDGFVDVDSNHVYYLERRTGGGLGLSYPAVVCNSTNPFRYKYQVESKTRDARDELSVYFAQRTSTGAVKFRLRIYNFAGDSLLYDEVVDTYAEPTNYGGTLRNIGDGVARLWKYTADLGGGSARRYTILIDELETDDRSVGAATNGDLTIYGFAFGKGVHHLNLAVSSTTLTQGSADNIGRGVDTDERVQKLKDFNANMVYIGWGTNDSKTGVTTPAQFKEDYLALIDDLRTFNPDIVIIAGTAPRGLGGPYTNNPVYNEVIREVAALKTLPLLDVEYLFDNGPSDWYADNVHPSSSGYQAIAGAFCDMLKIPTWEKITASSGVIATPFHHEFSIPSGAANSDFSGNDITVIEELIDVREDCNALEVRAKMIGARPSEMVEWYAKIDVNGLNAAGELTTNVTFDESMSNIPVVSGNAIGMMVLDRVREFSTWRPRVRVRLIMRDFRLRSANVINTLVIKSVKP